MQSIHTPPARCRVVIVRTENISPIDQRQRHGIIRQRQTTMGQRQEQWHAGATAGGGGRTGTRMQRSKVNDARERRREGTQKGGIDGEWADGRSEQTGGAMAREVGGQVPQREPGGDGVRGIRGHGPELSTQLKYATEPQREPPCLSRTSSRSSTLRHARVYREHYRRKNLPFVFR